LKIEHRQWRMPLTLFTSPRFADHLTPPGHPERVERSEVMQAVAAEFRLAGGDVREPRAASREEIARVHGTDYIGLIAETAGRATALDGDTFTSPETYDVACLAAGAVVTAVDHVLNGSGASGDPSHGDGRLPDSPAASGPSRALALVRPPGHHAERDRAMGFCFFNNIAIGAAHARSRGLARVAIVDFDVHHGNGTQWSFYDDPSVLFISSHQFPYYPGTGAANEIGSGAGTGFTINLPLATGATDADYELVYSRIAIPALRQFKPELVLISAGFDAHMDDPLGGMRLTAGCFGRLTALVAAAADDCCDGRVVAVTEGGYDLEGLAASLRETIDALDGQAGPKTSLDDDKPGHTEQRSRDTQRGEATLNAVQPLLADYWRI
jgi:acetoin utilization deacetylase AcuC-like enzyme